MSRIEIVIVIRLPQGEVAKEACMMAITHHISSKLAFENFILTTTNDGIEAEISFCFEKPACLDHVLEFITGSGAEVKAQFIQLPSSISGMVDAYDARDFGGTITSLVSKIEGVCQVSVSGNGNLRIQCETRRMDDLLETIKASLLRLRNH